ncbi:hypothetical protein [Acinetobacter puyangensis]|nr:hypothetical protein [Acinetobacter puyangensis]
MINVTLLINEEVFYEIPSSPITILDNDSLQIVIKNIDLVDNINDIEIYIEDYILPLHYNEYNQELTSIKDNVFRESFGYSTIRLYINNDIYKEIIFNVLTHQKKFEQIKEMVSYLINKNNLILDICFSRTKLEISPLGDSKATFESTLNLAEEIVSIFLTKKNSFSKVLKHYLEKNKEGFDNFNNFNIDPYEIFNNISDLFPSNDPESIHIHGRNFSLDKIKRDILIDSYNVEENQIIVGGLISIKNKLIDMQTILFHELNTNSLTYEHEYSNFKKFKNQYDIDNLYLFITTNGMNKRIENLINSIDLILFELQKKLNIKYLGFLYPKITQFVKNSSFYKNIFIKLFDWYHLGSPSIGVNQNLTKIRSTSKIYELFCLYHFIEKIHESGWNVIKSQEHSFFKNFIPEYIKFQKDSYILELFYDKTISSFDQELSLNNDLVYLKHNKKSSLDFYTPDFIFKINHINGNVKYFIFDAKYSSSNTLYKYNVLDELYRKYYTNLAIFNSESMTLESKNILAIIAIHPYGEKYLSKWKNIKNITIFPIVETFKLNNSDHNFNKYISFFESSL